MKNINNCKLPSIEKAGTIALTISENKKLNAIEQSFFVAGFQECVKYLNKLNKNYSQDKPMPCNFDSPGPVITDKQYGAEPSLREIVESYYNRHGVVNFKEVASEYLKSI